MRANPNCFGFAKTCAKRSHVFAAAKTGELGSREFPSGDEEITRDHKSF
jgi:hypothetical protein